jgi:hypothetical protein
MNCTDRASATVGAAGVVAFACGCTARLQVKALICRTTACGMIQPCRQVSGRLPAALAALRARHAGSTCVNDSAVLRRCAQRQCMQDVQVAAKQGSTVNKQPFM